MKKIYAAAALLLAAFTGANAQTPLPQTDLEAVVYVTENQPITPITGRGISWYSIIYQTNPFDSIQGAAFVRLTGDGTGLFEGDKVFFAAPTSEVSSNGVSGYIYTTPAGGVDTGLIFTGDFNNTATDSINTLLDIDSFNGGANMFSSLLVPRASLVTGKVYGWYLYCAAYPNTPGGSDSTYRDTIRSNNFTYVPVIWNSSVGVGNVSFKYDNMDVFPNPATGMLNYTVNIKKASNTQTIRIVDIVGRAVLTEVKGAVNVGTLTNKIDVSGLAAGTYTIQVITEYGVAASKFVKN